MGGFGSGRRGHRAIIEAGLTIDIRRLRRQGLFKGGTCAYGRSLRWQFANGRSASVEFSYDASGPEAWFSLRYGTTSDDRPAAIDEQFFLVAFPQPFGGRRWYFVCPSTGDRVQTLHCPPGAARFRSRRAFRGQVRYLSQGLARHDRYQRRCDKLKRRMLEAGPADWRQEHEDWDFPPKPPWMRMCTYRRQFEEWEECEAMALEGVMRGVLAHVRKT